MSYEVVRHRQPWGILALPADTGESVTARVSSLAHRVDTDWQEEREEAPCLAS